MKTITQEQIEKIGELADSLDNINVSISGENPWS